MRNLVAYEYWRIFETFECIQVYSLKKYNIYIRVPCPRVALTFNAGPFNP